MAAFRDSLNLFARQFALALHQSTRVRLGSAWAAPEAADDDALRASEAHLPGTGWIVGIAACLAFAVVALALRGNPWGAAAAAVASLVVTLLMTGAGHESALYRTVERLEAQGPSGLGTIVLVLALLAKVILLAALASVSEAGVIAALFAAHVLSRLAPLLVAHRLDGRHEPRTLRIAVLWCLPAVLLTGLAGGWAFLFLGLLAAGLACYGMLRLAANQPHADLPAASQQACELAFYLGAAIGA